MQETLRQHNIETKNRVRGKNFAPRTFFLFKIWYNIQYLRILEQTAAVMGAYGVWGYG